MSQLMDKDMNYSWRKQCKIPLAFTVENCIDELSICNMWKTHYESLLNRVQSCYLKAEVSSKTDKDTECASKFSIASITNLFSI